MAALKCLGCIVLCILGGWAMLYLFARIFALMFVPQSMHFPAPTKGEKSPFLDDDGNIRSTLFPPLKKEVSDED